MYSYKSKDSFSTNLPSLGKIFFRLILATILFGFLGFLFQRFFLFVHTMEDESMMPKYSKGSKIWMKRGGGIPDYGNVVMAQARSSQLVFFGQIVGKPGDKIMIKKKRVYRNGQEIKQEEVRFMDKRASLSGKITNRDNLESITIPKDMYFILCLDRDQCMDSREYGPIAIGKILGRSLF